MQVRERGRGRLDLGRDPDDRDAPAEMVAFCPVCASREFRMAAKLAETYR
jgi:hypothetical protein